MLIIPDYLNLESRVRLTHSYVYSIVTNDYKGTNVFRSLRPWRLRIIDDTLDDNLADMVNSNRVRSDRLCLSHSWPIGSVIGQNSTISYKNDKFGANMSHTISRESNNFEFSLEGEFLAFSNNQLPVYKRWNVIDGVKVVQFTEQVVTNLLTDTRISQVQTKTLHYQYSNVNESVEDDEWEDGTDTKTSSFKETYVLGQIDGHPVLIAVLGAYNNMSRIVTATSASCDSETVKVLEEIIDNVSKLSREPRFAPDKEYKKSTFNIIVQDSHGLSLQRFTIADLPDKETFIQDNYNEDFIAVNDVIIDSITNKNKGITLLHGIAGSGKTNYIRYIANMVRGKNLIYVPPDMAPVLAQPSFIGFVMDHKNSVFVIEDAETILKTREAGDNSAVANVLNMSDGIIGDAVQCQFVCTFNCEYKDIDSALKRKGRLNATYEFKELSVDKAQRLMDKLFPTQNIVVEKPMTLAQIYNYNTDNFNQSCEKTPIKIGF